MITSPQQLFSVIKCSAYQIDNYIYYDAFNYIIFDYILRGANKILIY